MEVKIENNEDLIKDTRNNTILLNNIRKRDEYLIRRNEKIQQLNSQKELSELKREMNEIKELLKELINVKSKS